jgi:hypothetical protein
VGVTAVQVIVGTLIVTIWFVFTADGTSDMGNRALDVLGVVWTQLVVTAIGTRAVLVPKLDVPRTPLVVVVGIPHPQGWWKIPKPLACDAGGKPNATINPERNSGRIFDRTEIMGNTPIGPLATSPGTRLDRVELEISAILPCKPMSGTPNILHDINSKAESRPNSSHKRRRFPRRGGIQPESKESGIPLHPGTVQTQLGGI